MIDLSDWEFKKRVKITLKDGNVVYCDTKNWEDEDDEDNGGDICCRRNADTKYWIEYLCDWVIIATDIESIEHY